MRDDYKLKGSTVHLGFDVEKEVAEKVSAMEKFTGLSASELGNTALKRFITHHSDFLPPPEASRKSRRRKLNRCRLSCRRDCWYAAARCRRALRSRGADRHAESCLPAKIVTPSRLPRHAKPTSVQRHALRNRDLPVAVLKRHAVRRDGVDGAVPAVVGDHASRTSRDRSKLCSGPGAWPPKWIHDGVTAWL